MQMKILIYRELLVNALLEGHQKRFEKELKLNGAISDNIVGPISHPYFNLRFVSDIAIFVLKRDVKLQLTN